MSNEDKMMWYKCHILPYTLQRDVTRCVTLYKMRHFFLHLKCLRGLILVLMAVHITEIPSDQTFGRASAMWYTCPFSDIGACPKELPVSKGLNLLSWRGLEIQTLD